jgi:hypothetical protein
MNIMMMLMTWKWMNIMMMSMTWEMDEYHDDVNDLGNG